MTRETWVIARGILIDAGIEPAWAKVKTGEQYLVLDAEVVRLRRATLEEAARAVCPDCGVGVRLLPQTAEWEYGHPDDDDYRYDCAACAIHDLIAALDKEASHE